uniref:ATP-dependent DNA helicase n=1 Tax=Octopus bimaculoides TaxID=37653 RepID=A0A0L8HNT5_OCTBM
MSQRGAMEVLGKTLQDIRDNNKFTRGVTLVLSGDFRQTLPIILRRTRSDKIKACIKSSHLWNEFSSWLFRLRNGKVSFDENGDISLAHIAIMVNSPAELKNRVLPDLSNNYNSHKWLCERAILTPKNDDTVARINLIQKYKPVDSIVGENQAVRYPTEFINSLEPPGISPPEGRSPNNASKKFRSS